MTVQTSAGDEVTYRPHLAKDMTAQSTVYREEQREIAPGDRIQINESYPKQGIRKGDLGTVTAISDTSDLDIRLDKGKSVQLNEEQAHHIEHGYAVQNIKAGAPERVLITQDTLEGQGDPISLSRNAREVSLYTSDGSRSNQALKAPIALPEQQQLEAPANVVAPEPMHVEHRRSIGR